MDNEQVRFERLVAGGDALGHLADGRVVFVPGALPGELVDVQITQAKKDFARGEVAAIIEPSAHRATPPCPNVERGCGGCSWQHLDVSQHMDAKVQIVREALKRTAKIDDADITVGGQVASEGTRTTVRMAVNAEGKLGFRRANSHDVIDTPTCLIAHPLLNNFIADVRVKGATEVTLRCAVATGEIGAWLHNEDGEEAPGASIKGLPKNAEVGRMAVVHEHVHDVALQVSMSAFFQASPQAAEMLVSAVNDAAGEEALTGQLGLVVDAYGGGGLFTATLVDNDVPVTIVESSPSACADARRNLHEHAVNIQQIAFEQWSPQVAGLVIADPARNGLGAAGVENLALTEASKVVLVSCDAVAGARDIRLLMNAGYTCDSITVLDLFPHTPHVEVVSAFTRT